MHELPEESVPDHWPTRHEALMQVREALFPCSFDVEALGAKLEVSPWIIATQEL